MALASIGIWHVSSFPYLTNFGCPPPHLFVFAGVQHQLVRVAGCHAGMALIPVIRDCICEDIPVMIEASLCNGTWSRIKHWECRESAFLVTCSKHTVWPRTFQPTASIFVPKADDPVRSCRGRSMMIWYMVVKPKNTCHRWRTFHVPDGS